MNKQVEMICVSDMEGFDWEIYRAAKEKLTRYLARFGWKFEDCVIEKEGKVWSCKPAAIWFLAPDPDPNNWD